MDIGRTLADKYNTTTSRKQYFYHRFDFDNIKILDHVPDYHQRNTAEKMHICNTKDTVNLLSDMNGLHESYVTFFKKEKVTRMTVWT